MHASGPGFMGLSLSPAMTSPWSSSQEVPSWETQSSLPASLLLVKSYPMEHHVISAAGAVSLVRADHRDNIWGKSGRGSQQKPPLNSSLAPTFSPILQTQLCSVAQSGGSTVCPEYRASKTSWFPRG